ncbi:MAG: hypothetical protein ACRDNI_13540 [Gaiellaceae bacterium]
MRRILVLLLLAMVTLAAGSAAAQAQTTFRTPGAQWVELRDGRGRAVLARKGAVNINIRRGRVRVVNLPGGSRPRRDCNKRGVRVTEYAIEYRGRKVRCLVSGPGPWQVIMTGRGINASGRVRGSLTLDGARSAPRGTYVIGTRAARGWPRSPRTFTLRR